MILTLKPLFIAVFVGLVSFLPARGSENKKWKLAHPLIVIVGEGGGVFGAAAMGAVGTYKIYDRSRFSREDIEHILCAGGIGFVVGIALGTIDQFSRQVRCIPNEEIKRTIGLPPMPSAELRVSLPFPKKSNEPFRFNEVIN